MSEQFLSGDTEINVLLEAMVKEILDDRRDTVGDRRAIILNDPEQCGHWIEEVIGRFSFKKFDNETTHAPRVSVRLLIHHTRENERTIYRRLS